MVVEEKDERTMFADTACRSWKSWFLDSARGPYNNCLGCMNLPVQAAQGWQLPSEWR